MTAEPRGRLGRLARHLREGTLLDAWRRRQGALPVHERVHWFGARDERDAAAALARHGIEACRRQGGGWVAVAGSPDALRADVMARLEKAGVAARALDETALLALDAAGCAGLALIACTHSKSRDQARMGRALVAHAHLAAAPLEYAPGLDPEAAQFREQDEYADTFFISPVLHDPVPVYDIYRESLRHFEQKCGLRDYLDLYQMLRHVHAQQVPGDICEFGSYRGHSGWLIARLLQALGSDKRLYMFDTFEKFPRESYGVDDFWSQTHDVDFGEVQRKLAPFPNVTLVRGDFTRTLEAQGPSRIALAYVDCDSYRATRYLVQAIWDARLSRKGAMVFEDYGHLALLGNRLAVDQDVREPNLGFQFFSQFSGFYVALKTD